MKVRAKKIGYYEHKRRVEGDEFWLVEKKYVDKEGKWKVLLPKEQFSNAWMESVEGSPAAHKPMKQKQEDKAEAKAKA